MCRTSHTAHIKDLTKAAIEMMERQGYSRHHLKHNRDVYNILEKYSATSANGTYSEQTGIDFLAETARRNLSSYSLECYNVAIKRINGVLAGETDWYPRRREKEYADSRFNDILRNYEVYQYNNEKKKWNVRNDTAVVARFLRFVDSYGINTLNDLTPQCIYAAFEDTNNKRHFQNCVSAFLRYVHRRSIVKTDFSPIVPSVRRRQPVPTVYSKEEIETLLASINRETAVGKRNYAIILIASRLGLRSCDIVNLKFDNINRPGKYIELIQTKTQEYLKLPLLPEIDEALSDYIDHARPKCENEIIFLKLTPPYTEALIPHSVYNICSCLFKKSGISINGRRIGPHTLRSSLATALLDEGNNHRAIGQALGQKDPDTVKSYVKTDVSHLRACALSVPAPSGVLEELLLTGGVL